MTTSATLSLGYVAVYVLLAGVASFIEMPAGRGFKVIQLNALIDTVPFWRAPRQVETTARRRAPAAPRSH